MLSMVFCNLVLIVLACKRAFVGIYYYISVDGLMI